MRCIRTVKALRCAEGSDLEAVALFTDADRGAPFVRHADRALRIEHPGGAVAAYLDPEGLLATLRRCGADAVWPGWGFVSEDPAFAERLEAAGICFLGPPAAVLRALGDKIRAKLIAEAVGVPVAAWSGGAVADAEEAATCGQRIGFPLLVKASAGGGGRGMRVVTEPDGLAPAFRSAAAEAAAAFGDATLFLESFVSGGRHIEVQIAADEHGRTVSFGCRDCSVQRRHQKVIEEAPPSGLDAGLLAELETAAVRIAGRAAYRGVGTVEFLVADGAFCFLEVNPRLQVEHAISEERYGVDLVELQIRIARGEAIPAPPPPRPLHAIEVRVCAEDPERDFAPSPGRIACFDPALGPRLRVDSGVSLGVEIPAAFDSLVAKVIAWGESREAARARLVTALTDFDLVVRGGASNKGHLIDLLEHPAYRAGEVDTQWLDDDPSLRRGSSRYEAQALVVAAILAYRRSRDAARLRFYQDPGNLSAAATPPSLGERVQLRYWGRNYEPEVFAIGEERYRVQLAGRSTAARLHSRGDYAAHLSIAGSNYRVLYDSGERGLRIEIEGHPYGFGSEAGGQVRASSPAMVIALDVAVGDRVETGHRLGLLEAMKLEVGFAAPVSGVVVEIAARVGQQVAAGDLLLVIEAAHAEEDRGGRAIELPTHPAPLDLFFPDGAEQPDLCRADAADGALRRAAVAAVRDEIRQIFMGYDVDPARVDRLVALLAAPLPAQLSPAFRDEFAEIRFELTLFADLEELFVRAPRDLISGEAGPSNYARMRMYVRRLSAEGAGISEEFLVLLRRALTHYGVQSLTPGEALRRAVLRLFASQRQPELRHRLALELVRRLETLAAAGTPLGEDRELAEALARMERMRGLLSDTLADAAALARYAIFESASLELAAERTTKEVETWLRAAEAELQPPPRSVLAHLADATQTIFDRVGNWIDAPDPRRRSIAAAARLRRLYRPEAGGKSTSGSVGGIQIERLDLPDGRIVLGSAVLPEELPRALRRLDRAARAAAAGVGRERSHAIELWVPATPPAAGNGGGDLDTALAAAAGEDGPGAEQLTLHWLPPGEAARELRTYVARDGHWRPGDACHGLHPAVATRLELERLCNFELELLGGSDDVYGFYLRSRDVPGDERIVVLGEVRGRVLEAGREMELHVPSFERIFLEAARSLRRWLAIRDPRRGLQWNRIVLFATPPIYLDPSLVQRLARRLAPATRRVGLEKVVVRLRALDRDSPDAPPRELELAIANPTGGRLEITPSAPHRDPLVPIRRYERKVVEARRRLLVYPYEIIRMLRGGATHADASAAELPSGHFAEYELDPTAQTPRAVPVERPHGGNPAGIVFGIITTPTEKVPEGMARVLLLSDPTRGMGALAAPECDRIVAALDLAAERQLPVEWVPVSSGARIAMDSGTENLDATARVVRRIVDFTQRGGVIHIIVYGINVGAQSYFDALATMLQHCRGALIMTPEASMVLTGRAALEASGSVSAEDETAIGGFERIMGPNGEAPYYAHDLADAYRILYQHYRYSYVVPGEAGPRRARSDDPPERPWTQAPLSGEDGFRDVGEIFDDQRNPGRKRPFAMRGVMAALIDADGGHLERWRSWAGAEIAIVWDAQLGGFPVSLIGIESRNLPRLGYLPADGPANWTGGALFPQSSKKIAHALNAASGNRPAVVLANLSGFDGSPESMRKLQLEYGAEIARAVVNFRGPLFFVVLSRYHGGAYVVFSRSLNAGLRAYALTGSYASVIGGGPAAAVVFSREVRARAAADPRAHGQLARERFDALWRELLLEKQAEVAAEFDAIHTVERALEVGSLDAILRPEDARRQLIAALEELAAGHSSSAPSPTTRSPA